ncbi:hypothetical protein E2562_027174 [Oryza meyeriana var. granulata]|uniref:rRNA N-glycosylase n=1 Tax=Oryza meyeriana var. granulata TaxID=110450 RepID=A0A6G1EQ49_9ORYZ|nr:hypothetical protein E2562_027174 [Oryza meyeriana var. granulata]
MVEGKPVCLPTGYFEIILFPKPSSDLAANHPNGRVWLLFFYGNLYLVAFKAQGKWYKFKDLNPDIAPNYASDERKKHCKAKDIPFKSNYGVREMSATIAELKVSRETPIEMYKTLSLYDPEHHAGRVRLSDLQLMLFKSCAIFSEVIRFPIMKNRLVYLIGSRVDENSTVGETYTDLFQNWDHCCIALRKGRHAFVPMCIRHRRIQTFDQLLTTIGVVLPV